MSGLTDKQLAFRRTGITSSDLVAIAGATPVAGGASAHDVWASKVLGKERAVSSEAADLGQELEPVIIRRAAAKIGLHVVPIDPEKLSMSHPEHPTHIATPDALLAQTRLHDPEALLQAKLVGYRMADEWGEPEAGADGVPEHVLIQAAWEMYVARKPVNFVGALFGTTVDVYRLELTPDVARLIEALRELADRFWADCVVSRRPPVLDGSEGASRMLKTLFPRASGAVVRADAEVEQLAAQYFADRDQLSSLEAEIDRKKQLLIAACGENAGIVGEGWRLKLEERKERSVTPAPYVVAAYRHFDMRRVGPGVAKASGRKSGKAAA